MKLQIHFKKQVKSLSQTILFIYFPDSYWTSCDSLNKDLVWPTSAHVSERSKADTVAQCVYEYNIWLHLKHPWRSTFLRRTFQESCSPPHGKHLRWLANYKAHTDSFMRQMLCSWILKQVRYPNWLQNETRGLTATVKVLCSDKRADGCLWK